MYPSDREQLSRQPFQEYRKPLSAEEILHILNELLRLEELNFDVPQRIQIVITSLETNRNLAPIESMKFYRMIQELIMKLIADLARYYQKLVGDVGTMQLESDQLSWIEKSFRPYAMVNQALLEQYRAVALKLTA